jgi:hypothetical protein
LYVPSLIFAFHELSSCLLGGAQTLAPRFGSLLIRVLQFADDTALIAIGRQQMQKLLDRFSEYCDLNGLTINAGKTEIINLRHGVRGSKHDVWTLAGSSVPIKSNARYLGVLFSTGKKATHHARYLRSKNLSKVWALVGRIRRGNLSNTAFLLRLFQALITSSATYGAGLLFPFPISRLSSQIKSSYVVSSLNLESSSRYS